MQAGWAVGLGSFGLCGLVGFFGYLLIEGAREYAEGWSMFLGVVLSCGLLLTGGYALLFLLGVAAVGYLIPEAVKATGDDVALLYASLALGTLVLDGLAVLEQKASEKWSQITGI
jgi:hypothetical protein